MARAKKTQEVVEETVEEVVEAPETEEVVEVEEAELETEEVVESEPEVEAEPEAAAETEAETEPEVEPEAEVVAEPETGESASEFPKAVKLTIPTNFYRAIGDPTPKRITGVIHLVGEAGDFYKAQRMVAGFGVVSGYISK